MENHLKDERYDETLLHVLRLGNQESQRFNHYEVYTQNILLGIVKLFSTVEGTRNGAVWEYLLSKEIDLRLIRLQVEKVTQCDFIGMSAVAYLPSSPRTELVLKLADDLATKEGATHIALEHVFWALGKVEDSVASQVMKTLGLGADDFLDFRNRA